VFQVVSEILRANHLCAPENGGIVYHPICVEPNHHLFTVRA